MNALTHDLLAKLGLSAQDSDARLAISLIGPPEGAGLAFKSIMP